MTEILTQRLMTLKRLPVRYLFIPKCGCTYVKNLLWNLEKGQSYQSPLRIHDVDDRLLRAADLKLTTEQIRNEEFAFTVLRNPVDRFYSLYTDKVVGRGHKMYVPLRAVLAQKYGLNVQARTLEAHTQNCEILIEWLAENLRSEQDLSKEAHWTPQMYRKNILREFNLKILLVKDLTRHLETLLVPLVPDIKIVLAGLEKNVSVKQFNREKVITPVLRKRINQVFAQDRAVFESVRDRWKSNPTMKSEQIPRALDVL